MRVRVRVRVRVVVIGQPESGSPLSTMSVQPLPPSRISLTGQGSVSLEHDHVQLVAHIERRRAYNENTNDEQRQALSNAAFAEAANISQTMARLLQHGQHSQFLKHLTITAVTVQDETETQQVQSAGNAPDSRVVSHRQVKIGCLASCIVKFEAPLGIDALVGDIMKQVLEAGASRLDDIMFGCSSERAQRAKLDATSLALINANEHLKRLIETMPSNIRFSGSSCIVENMDLQINSHTPIMYKPGHNRMMAAPQSASFGGGPAVVGDEERINVTISMTVRFE